MHTCNSGADYFFVNRKSGRSKIEKRLGRKDTRFLVDVSKKNTPSV
jgi:hypothetical protein